MSNHIFGTSGLTAIDVATNGYCAHITGDHVLIFSHAAYDGWNLEDIYEEYGAPRQGVKNGNIWLYDLTEKIPYFWEHPDECIVWEITTKLMDEVYLGVSYWESGEYFAGPDLRHYTHDPVTGAVEYIQDSKGKLYYVKGVTTSRKTGEITGFVCYTWKHFE